MKEVRVIGQYNSLPVSTASLSLCYPEGTGHRLTLTARNLPDSKKRLVDELTTKKSAHPDGEPLWMSWSLLGSVHDTRAARVWRIAEPIKDSGLIGLGDKRYVSLSKAVLCPFKGRGKPQWKKDANSEHAKLRSPGERAIAQLKNWDVLRWLRCRLHRAGEIT
ncbi:hypothetical protein GCM10009602_35380 [Nocardiopsis tropica]